MADEFRAVVTQEFRAGGYEVVDKPGPGVLRLHFALTGVNPERPGFTPLDVLPIKIAINAARFATGTDKTVIAISGEAEVLDGVTGERLFALGLDAQGRPPFRRQAAHLGRRSERRDRMGGRSAGAARRRSGGVAVVCISRERGNPCKQSAGFNL